MGQERYDRGDLLIRSGGSKEKWGHGKVSVDEGFGAFGACYFCVQPPIWIQVAEREKLEPFRPGDKVRKVC